MKKIFFLTSVFIVFSIAPAYPIDVSQRWDKTFDIGGFSHAFSIQQTLDGGYVVVGTTDFFTKLLVLKLDYNGDTVWQKTYDAEGPALSVKQTSDGGYIVSGWIRNEVSLVLRLDGNGAIIWQKTYEALSNASIIQTDDGGFILTGHQYGNYFDSLILIKLYSNGDIYGTAEYTIQKASSTYTEYKDPISQTSDGGYIVACESGGKILVLKLNSGGGIIWHKTYGGESLDFAFSIEETSDGGFIVAGGTYSFGAGANDFWVLKLDSSGNVSWQKTYGGESSDLATSIKQTPDGGYIVLGSSHSFGGESNLWILKLNSAGDVSWQKIYLERKSGYLPTVDLTADGGYAISTASSNPSTNDWKIWVLKLDSNGEIPDCEVLSTTNAIVSDTIVSGEDSNINVSGAVITAETPDFMPQGISASISSICQYDDPLDPDGDGIENYFGASFTSTSYNGSFLVDQDNCPSMPNGPFLGVCSKGSVRGTCIADEACGVDGVCSMNQEDSYPPQGNGIGDACDCEGDFDCDGDCDGSDAAAFKLDFGRSGFNNPCTNESQCHGDFECDNDCDGSDAANFKIDFGRSGFNNPCPACTVGDSCNYPSP